MEGVEITSYKFLNVYILIYMGFLLIEKFPLYINSKVCLRDDAQYDISDFWDW